MKQWMIKPNRADLSKIAARYKISEILAEVLVKRGLYDWEAMDAYLYPSMDKLHDVHDIYDLDHAVSIIRDKIDSDQKIQVIGDYDVDGVMSTSILVKGLRKLGAEVSWRVPHRERDGYGVRDYMAREAFEQGVDTIITCDNGISAVDAVSCAKELGMTVIVADHHDVPINNETGQELLPPADAVVDLKRKDSIYPWRELCGAAVAYRLIEALFEEREESAFLDELLSMAAVATVCDVVPLQSENRIIVSRGLELLQNSTNKGLSSLIRQLELNREVDSGCIGFRIGPCINAAGRLQDASTGVELMLAEDQKEADAIAAHLIELNEERKDITARATEQAVKQIEEEGYLDQNVLVVFVEECPESVAGIVAGRIKEKYYRPTMILTRSGDHLKGSGRSIPGYHMQQELNACASLLLEYGGHAMAAGFSLEEEKLKPLRDALNERCRLTPKDLIEKITIDREVAFAEVSGNLVRELNLLQPVGEQNKGALFARRGLEILSVKIRGKEGQVGSFTVRDQGRRYNLVDFQIDQCMKKEICAKYSEAVWESLERGNANGCVMDIIYIPRINERYGELQYTIVDCR
ncbi:single-stranded-DNA-specific exonuclease RecJ [Jutongia sp.]